jgi:hypothetical protein
MVNGIIDAQHQWDARVSAAPLLALKEHAQGLPVPSAAKPHTRCLLEIAGLAQCGGCLRRKCRQRLTTPTACTQAVRSSFGMEAQRVPGKSAQVVGAHGPTTNNRFLTTGALNGNTALRYSKHVDSSFSGVDHARGCYQHRTGITLRRALHRYTTPLAATLSKAVTVMEYFRASCLLTRQLASLIVVTQAFACHAVGFSALFKRSIVQLTASIKYPGELFCLLCRGI